MNGLDDLGRGEETFGIIVELFLALIDLLRGEP
jgi:hypothetical protein